MLKVIKSFKVFYDEDKYPTMFSRMNNDKFYITKMINQEPSSSEISRLQYASAFANYLIGIISK